MSGAGDDAPPWRRKTPRWVLAAFAGAVVFLAGSGKLASMCGDPSYSPQTRMLICALADPGMRIGTADHRWVRFLADRAMAAEAAGHRERAFELLDDAWAEARADQDWKTLWRSGKEPRYRPLPFLMIRELHAGNPALLDAWVAKPPRGMGPNTEKRKAFELALQATQEGEAAPR
ncbi:hypothetical protein ACQ5SO_05485 [Rhodovulum sp. DZ06]|uniref:hypothetical protein n=1 Tax=Rhodovulum sp. DZ06 TaxID=3425126 RepID=UPI003D35211B